MKRFLIVVTILIVSILSISAFLIAKKTASNIVKNEEIHYHAGFVVFENGKKLDFSDTKYMYIKSCTLDGEEDESLEDSQLEKAHLHDNVGDVVHVEGEGAVWGDLFANIKFPIDYSKVTGYINGYEEKDFQNKAINSDDSLVLFVGPVNEKLLTQAVTAKYIEETAANSGPCSD